MATELSAEDAIAAGRAALLRGAWREARARFEEALAVEESPAAFEGLGVAARYLWDADAAVSAHERGYRLARRQADRGAAAKLAAQLALDAYGLDRISEANGWTERALMLTETAGPSEARAFALALRAHVAMLRRNDPAETLRLAEQALETARAAGSTDVELVALALQGLALVCSGSVEEGMRCLDAATAAAVAGEVSDVDLAESICCYLIDACKRVRDLDRAAEWCERVAQIARRFDDRFMFAVCRVHHADVLIWQGAWDAADGELATAAALFSELGTEKLADSVVRLAELRRRQGRLEDAAELLADCEGHPLHDLHAGLLALDRGDPAGALEAAERFLRRVGTEDRLQRMAGLELLVRAALQCGRREEAAEAAAEIHTTADAVGTRPLRASALLAQARLAAAHGDYRAARAGFEDAAAAFDAAGARYDAAHSWLEAAAALRAGGDHATASAAEARAQAMLAALGTHADRRTFADGPLSRREREVLVLVAAGRSNDEIAAALFLSVRTVERHVANTYRKLGLSGRSARAAAASWAHAHGIA
ncbi:MAG TPA: LuxR C-terminal-related transcriptional regulator [Gaiellaceae bacterium]|nr:LuxR C-terminal-related transcriptional regulator [Gaiellaceae bacterium]